MTDILKIIIISAYEILTKGYKNCKFYIKNNIIYILNILTTRVIK
jgi:hypothetical protein